MLRLLGLTVFGTTLPPSLMEALAVTGASARMNTPLVTLFLCGDVMLGRGIDDENHLSLHWNGRLIQ